MIIPGIPGVMGWYSTRQAGFDPGIIPVFPVRSQSPALPSRRRSINTELKHSRFSSASSRLWGRFPCSPWQRAKLSREGAATTNPSPIHGFPCAAGDENPRESHPKPSPSIPEWFLGKERDEQPRELCQGPAPQEFGNRLPRARSLGLAPSALFWKEGGKQGIPRAPGCSHTAAFPQDPAPAGGMDGSSASPRSRRVFHGSGGFSSSSRGLQDPPGSGSRSWECRNPARSIPVLPALRGPTGRDPAG